MKEGRMPVVGRPQRKRRRGVMLAVTLAAVWLLGGCAATPELRYYRVEFPPVPRAAAPPLPVTLGIDRLSAPEACQQERIIYRASPYRVQSYGHDRWESPPVEMVEALLLERFAESGRFQRVVPWRREEVDYRLQARLLRFEEVDEGENWYGVVELTYELLDGSGRSLMRETSRQRVRADRKSVEAVVEALSRGLQAGLDEAIARTAAAVAVARR
jgi:ABC-type uncharacterized transport system auxiliary subunit